MEGLVIREPWIGRILAGFKTWEMRSTGCRKRGQIALIRAGSRLVVGVAELVGSLAPLESLEAYAAAEQFHAIRPDEQKTAHQGGWRTPWVLSNARALPAPVAYEHPSGAVTWVILDPLVVQAVEAQVGERSTPNPAPATSRTSAMAALLPTETPARDTPKRNGLASVTSDSRRVRLTGGNIRNAHVYVPLDFFPEDAIGGSNKHEAALRALRVSFVPGASVETDIDGTKRILRARAEVRDFFLRAELKEGDSVLIERTAPYSFRFSKA
jgi:hypothetical protein